MQGSRYSGGHEVRGAGKDCRGGGKGGWRGGKGKVRSGVLSWGVAGCLMRQVTRWGRGSMIGVAALELFVMENTWIQVEEGGA